LKDWWIEGLRKSFNPPILQSLNPFKMNRREAIKRTALLMGGTLSASAMLGVLNGCKAEPAITWEPQFFSADEAGLMEAIAERIMPKTDTPGAIDAGVPSFIDTMMAEFYQEKEKKAFREALQLVEKDAKDTYGKSFVKLEPAMQDELLNKYDKEAYEQSQQKDAEPHFFRTMKELTLLGYFTSEVGATEFLKYDPVPGDYKGCIPYSEVGRAWAT
jgi:hypothetical protein